MGRTVDKMGENFHIETEEVMMNRNRLSPLLIGLGLAVVSATLVAHHSVSAEFDTSKKITFTGTVKKLDWGNPHIYIHVEAKAADGKLIVYKVEGGPPNSLYRSGVRPDLLKLGTMVTCTNCSP